VKEYVAQVVSQRDVPVLSGLVRDWLVEPRGRRRGVSRREPADRATPLAAGGD